MNNSPTSGQFLSVQNSTKLAFWIFLGGEVTFFITLILTFILFRLDSPNQYNSFRSNLNIPLIGVNTFILITSSYLVVRTLEAVDQQRLKSFKRNLLGVVLLGAIFLAGQAYEWVELFRKGIGVSNLVGTPFFTITGIHGAHVFIGLVWATTLLILSTRPSFSPIRHGEVEIFGLYWHFVDIIWILLFTLIYLL